MDCSAQQAAVRDRADRLPDDVWDCERCGTDESMQLRRSSLNEAFFADDIGLKCEECSYYATHGVPFSDPEQFRRELAARDGRVFDFAQDTAPDENRAAQLEALGYIAAAEATDT